MAREVVNRFVSKADYFVITSFSKAKVKKKKTFVVSPIIRADVRKVKPRNGNKVLVYLTKKDSKLIKLLKKTDEKFVVYGYNKVKATKNLEFKTKETFLDDLKNCKAIIATSGFTLMSEALFLKKPYFALPLGGQFEQVLNALFLKQAGYGDFSEDVSIDDICKFLSNLDKYNARLKKYSPNPDELFQVFDKILKIKNKKQV